MPDSYEDLHWGMSLLAGACTLVGMPDAYRRAYSKGTTEKQQKNEEQEKTTQSPYRTLTRDGTYPFPCQRTIRRYRRKSAE